MWVMTFHAACARMLRAHADRLGYTRQFTIYDQADSRRLIKRCLDDLGIDPKRFTPGGDPQPDLRRQEQAARRRCVRADGRLVLRADRGRRLPQLRARAAPHERDGLRRPARARGQRARAVPGGPRALRRDVPPRARRRVPGHQPRPVPLAAAAGRRAAEPHGGRRRRTSRSTGSAAPTSATSSSSRTTFPTPTWSSSSRTTARPRRSSTRPTRSSRNNRGRSRSRCGPSSARAIRSSVRELEDEHAEARFVTGEIQRLLDEGVSRARSRSSTGPTPSRACWRTRSCARRFPTR